MAITEINVPQITDEDRSLAQTTLEAILRSGEFRLEAGGKTFAIPKSAVKQIVSVLDFTAESVPVKVVPTLPELTVQQAAKFLKMSERHVNDLLDQGTIAFRTAGEKRMVLRDSVTEFEQERERGFAILAEMTREAQEMGLYDD